jgi:hypothetical protein
MADGVVSTKFVGNATDAERAIAELEKKYAELANKVTEHNSKAKTEAMAAREAQKQADKQAAEALRKQRADERAALAQQREDRRKSEREAAQLLRAKERDDREATRTAARAAADAARQQAALAKEAAREQQRNEREAAREQKRLDAESRREAAATARERVRAKREEVRERKRLMAEEAREQKRIEAESERIANATSEWVMTIGKAGAAYIGVSATLDMLIGQNQKLIEQADEQGLKQDKLARKFRVQGELGKLKGDEAAQSINKIALKNTVTPEHAFSAAEALASHGFSAADASGPALDVILQGMAANNMIGEDPAQLAAAMAMKLDVFGKEKNAKNLKASVVASQRLSKPTNTKVTDIAAYASKMSGIAESVDEKTADSIMAIVHQTAATDVTGTAVKIFFDRSKGAASNSQTKAALKQMKIVDQKTGKPRTMTPGDVDMVGEDAETVMRRWNEGFKSLPKEMQAGVRNKAFGTEAASSAKFLLDHVDQIQQFNALQGDAAGFEKDVAINTSGSAAARRRTDVEKELQFASKYNDVSLIFDQLEMNRRTQGRSEMMTGLERKNAELIRYMGGSTEYAASKLTPFGPEGEKQYIRALEQVQDKKGGEIPVGIAPKYEEMLRKRMPPGLAAEEGFPVEPVAPAGAQGTGALPGSIEPTTGGMAAAAAPARRYSPDDGAASGASRLESLLERQNSLVEQQTVIAEKQTSLLEKGQTAPIKRPRQPNADE